MTMQSPSLKHYIKLVKLVLLFLRRLLGQWVAIIAKQLCLYNNKGEMGRMGNFQLLRSVPSSCWLFSKSENQRM